MKGFFGKAKMKVGAAIAVVGIGMTQAQAAILPADSTIDTTEFLAIAGVVGVSYLAMKGVKFGLGLLKSA